MTDVIEQERVLAVCFWIFPIVGCSVEWIKKTHPWWWVRFVE
jgi:hypothetical protein